jgi:UDP-3-O-[3-hydroxymyristoyl] N-acetylglucosamine deacetylase
VQLSPHSEYKLTCSTGYQHPVDGCKIKKATISLTPSSFQREISRARSFSFARDEEMLHNKARSQNGNRDGTVIVDDYRMQDLEGLRYENEFLRHQLLDTIGDLYLLGSSLIGEYVGHLANHKLNYSLLKALLNDPSAWERVLASDVEYFQDATDLDAAVAI